MSHVLIAIYLFIISGAQGCSIKMTALRTTAEILSEATQEIETENNWQVFKDGVPAALKTLEGLLYVDPTNEDLLISLTKGYAAYGFAIYETLHLKEKLAQTEDMPMKHQALDHYDRSIRYGLRWLMINGITVNTFAHALKEDKGSIYLDGHLDGDEQQHIEGIFFLGQSWLNYINMQRDMPALIGQLFIVKGLFDWACSKQPDFRFGSCHVFYGAYEASRPKILGGNPEKAAEIFRKAIEQYPNNLFLRTAFIEYYAIPLMDEEVYQKQKASILTWIKAASGGPAVVPGQATISLESKKATGQIYNSIALRRFRIIRQYEKNLF